MYGVWGEKNMYGKRIWGVKRTTFWGTEEVVNTMQVVMVSPQSQWMVESYSDSFYSPTMKE